MKQLLFKNLITVFMSILTPELLKSFADMVLDFAENYVEGTKSTVDDKIVLPICATIRAAFDIPDDDAPIQLE